MTFLEYTYNELSCITLGHEICFIISTILSIQRPVAITSYSFYLCLLNEYEEKIRNTVQNVCTQYNVISHRVCVCVAE